MRTAALLSAVLLLLAPPLLAKKDDPRTKWLKQVAKLVKAGDAGAIADRFPEKRKVRLSLTGIKSGHYRDSQAKSLLSTWFKTIVEMKDCKFKKVQGSVGRFELTYELRATGKVVKKARLEVYLKKEGESWEITGIVEP